MQAPVYVDSPLAISATEIFKRNTELFEEEIKDGDVLFNYQLMKGRATTRNAIKLLEIIGYDDKVIEKARNQADIFLSQGIWKRP